MNRKDFIKSISLMTAAASTMKLQALDNLTRDLPSTDVMPVLFVGHGSPMNAIEDNEFSRGWQKEGQALPRPRAILCISAHWETRGTWVTAMEKPRTIHDFGGFPEELYQVQYPAPGMPSLAKDTKDTVKKTDVGLDESWGLDHGAWSVIKHLYPMADVPVLQLSLDSGQPPQYHYDLAKELASLRRKGVLIVGSGNMVHNLGRIAWDKMHDPEYAYDWAKEADAQFKKYILAGDYKPLIQYSSLGNSVRLAVPTPDHFLPMLYTLALKGEKEELRMFNDKAVMGSITMTSLRIG